MQLKNLLSILIPILLSLGLASSEMKNCEQENVALLTKQCENPKSIKSLNDFFEFYYNFEHLYTQCLQLTSVNKKPEAHSLEAESKCQAGGFYFQQMRPFARLVAQWMSGEPVCTIEFIIKLYHFHNQLHQSSDHFSILSRLLRSLANSVAAKCRLSLANRLRQVESRAPDTAKYVNLIVGLTNLGSAKLSSLRPFEVVEKFVPILERELPEKIYGSRISSLGRDGFEFKLSQSVRVSHDTVRMSCKAMKVYHVNLLGSLGLLASLGYASPIQVTPVEAGKSSGQQGSEQQVFERGSDSQLIDRWLMSALLCQNIRNTLKMASVNVEGKQVSRLKIVETQEADVEIEDEQDSTFATFKLRENDGQDEEDRKLAWKVIANPNERFATFAPNSNLVNNLNARKLHLLTGPGYRHSTALMTYLDLAQTSARLEAINRLLGTTLSFNDQTSDDDEEEEEEEE